MKKIAVVNHSFFPLSETFIYRQLQGLSTAHEVILLGTAFINETSFPHRYKMYTYQYHYGKLDGMISTFLKYLHKNQNRLSPTATEKITNFLRTEQVTCIHAHFGYTGIRMLPIAKELGLPLIVSFHGVDASEEFVQRAEYRRMLRELFAYAAGIVIVSSHMHDTLQLTPFADKVRLIPYGVDTDHFCVERSVTVDPVLHILHVGRLVNKKGVPDLIRVFLAIHKKYTVHLHIVGDGPEKEQCMAIIQEQGEPVPVTLWGSQPQDFIFDMLARAHIFVLNSRIADSGDMEGLPNGILEAMSMGLPVISTYHAGIPDAIQSGVNGVLVQERNQEELKQAIVDLIEHKEKRLRIGKAARETVCHRFSLQSMTNGLIQLFNHISSS